MVTITLTHANKNIPIEIYIGQLFAQYYDENLKATILLSTGMTAIPVSETLDQIKEILNERTVQKPK
jgi:hypothetical protein